MRPQGIPTEPQRPDRAPVFAMIGGIVGLAGGPLLGLLGLVALDAVDPDQHISFSVSIMISALLPSALLFTLAALGPRRWRPMVVGLAAGSAVSCLVLGVPLIGIDAVDF
ncbi:MAG: hypothetical protein JWQ70_2479 [Aeromicrobium sp.]|nr:hypothetical protein [Aeromicrobium sp.]